VVQKPGSGLSRLHIVLIVCAIVLILPVSVLAILILRAVKNTSDAAQQVAAAQQQAIMHPNAPPPLTEEQRIAWAKLRRTKKEQCYQLAALVSDSRLAAFSKDPKRWEVWGLGRDGYGWGPAPAWDFVDSGKRPAIEIAREEAMAIVQNPAVRIIAIVDLYSAENPQVVEWVHDDGHGAKTLADAPSQEYADGLKGYFGQLQAESR
jgi:hypothetical protein